MAVVAKKESYGYELVQEISKELHIAEGTVYPLLRRLTGEGYFSTYLEESRDGPSRKYYRITEIGRSKLDELLGEWREFNLAVNNILRANE